MSDHPVYCSCDDCMSGRYEDRTPFYGRCRICGGNLAECISNKRHVEQTVQQKWRLSRFIRQAFKRSTEPPR